jgi:alginate O-acetyltransferase complex protein AlgF
MPNALVAVQRQVRLGLAVCMALGFGSSQAQDPKLYETGPGADASFVRFLNATDQGLEVRSSSKTSLAISAAKPVSDYFPISSKTKLKGTLVQGGSQKEIDLKINSGEFVTVVGTAVKASGLDMLVVRENPDDFNALKASVAFYNLVTECKAAGLGAVGRKVSVFDQVASGAMQRRSVNPVALKVEASCAGQALPQQLDLGMLEAGKRYSVFLISGKDQKRLIFAVDTIAH